jgi:hypothetical protein
LPLTRKLCLVLEGGFSEGGKTYGPQSWLRLPIGAHFSACVASEGCRVWIKEGHLRHVQAARPTDEGECAIGELL